MILWMILQVERSQPFEEHCRKETEKINIEFSKKLEKTVNIGIATTADIKNEFKYQILNLLIIVFQYLKLFRFLKIDYSTIFIWCL